MRGDGTVVNEPARSNDLEGASPEEGVSVSLVKRIAQIVFLVIRECVFVGEELIVSVNGGDRLEGPGASSRREFPDEAQRGASLAAPSQPPTGFVACA